MENLIINMLLRQLIENLPKEKKNIKIRGLETNSKKIKKGFIFFAIKGNKVNVRNILTKRSKMAL